MIISLVSRTPSRLLLILVFHLVACQKNRMKLGDLTGRSLLEEVNEQINEQNNGQVKKQMDKNQSMRSAAGRSLPGDDPHAFNFLESVGLFAIFAVVMWFCCMCFISDDKRQGKLTARGFEI